MKANIINMKGPTSSSYTPSLSECGILNWRERSLDSYIEKSRDMILSWLQKWKWFWGDDGLLLPYKWALDSEVMFLWQLVRYWYIENPTSPSWTAGSQSNALWVCADQRAWAHAWAPYASMSPCSCPSRFPIRLPWVPWRKSTPFPTTCSPQPNTPKVNG